jgi:hypothetical protein
LEFVPPVVRHVTTGSLGADCAYINITISVLLKRINVLENNFVAIFFDVRVS